MRRNKISGHNPFGVKQGYFTQFKNPDKYISTEKKVAYQSGLELKFCIICDSNPKILKWMNEPFSIPYFNPIKQSKSNYWPDFYIEVLQDDGNIKKLLVEVKPMDLTPQKLARPSKYASASTWKTYHSKLKQVIVNKAKWEASVKYCSTRNMHYIFLTEKFFDSYK